MVSYGYVGKIARINLSDWTYKEERLSEDILKKWIGGRGLGVYFFLKEVDPRINPLSEENKIIVATGPLTGIPGAPSSGRVTSITKSPITNGINWSGSGGTFGPFLKFSGYDLLIIEGKSEKPVWILINNGQIELRDASDLWGKDVFETNDILISRLRSEGFDENKISILAIGPAGENLVKYASVLNEKHKAMGRGGHGCVWGSKKLKAIVVTGNSRLEIYDRAKFVKAMQNSLIKIRNSILVKDLRELGTFGMLLPRIGKYNAIPSFNFTGFMAIDPEKILEEWKKLIDPERSKKEICWGCPIGCKKYVRFNNFGSAAPEYWGGFVSFGSSIGSSNIKEIIKDYSLCNKYGLDAISTGHVISVLYELSEKGKVDLKLEWGDQSKIPELIEKIAYRRDIGNDLAEGSKYIANKYGLKDSAVTIRNIEIGLCHPSSAQGYGLALATSNRGDHNQTMLRDEILLNKLNKEDTGGKPEYVVHMQNLFAVVDSLVLCLFTTYALDFEDYALLVSSVTGLEFTAKDLYEIGNRIYSAERYFNYLAFGDGYEFDRLPDRVSGEIKLSEMLPKYYEIRGWENGVPTKETLKKLDIPVIE